MCVHVRVYMCERVIKCVHERKVCVCVCVCVRVCVREKDREKNCVC